MRQSEYFEWQNHTSVYKTFLFEELLTSSNLLKLSKLVQYMLKIFLSFKQEFHTHSDYSCPNRQRQSKKFR